MFISKKYCNFATENTNINIFAMRITLSTLLVLLLSLLISSCENQFPTNTEDNDDFPTDTVDTLESQINTYDYIGEYEMETRVICVLADGTLDTLPLPEIVVDPVSIYLKDTQLYVLTYHFGMPNLDKEEPIIFLKSPNRKCISEEPTETTTNIEPVEDSTTRIAIMNGFVYTIIQGDFVGSKPIVVSRINETSLEFQPSEIFKIQLIDVTGESYCTCHQHFEYKPMYKQDGRIQWDVELIWEYDNPLYLESDPLATTSIKYHNTLRKKD